MSWSGAPWWKAHERSGWYQNQQLVRHSRRRSGPDKVLLEQEWDVVPHMSLGLGQTASLEPVVEAAIDVGVRALAGIEADSAKLPVKPPGYSVSLTRPRVLLPLHECSWISCSNWYVLSFCLHECCRCELALDEDSRTTFGTGWPFIEKNKVWDSDLRLGNARWFVMFMQK